MLNSSVILTKLERLGNLDRERLVFGAAFHNYVLNPCLDEGVIRAVEGRYGFHLPEDYRRFLLEVGNGGAGPYYGLFKLGEHDDGWGFCSWEGGYLLGDPSAPFPYQSSWNLPYTFWSEAPYNKEWASEEESDRAYEAWDTKLEEAYWAPSVMNGAIPICHLGCALRQWLVVTGSERGNVWGDERVDDRGVYPLVTGGGDRVTFSKWYLSWLDDSIRSVEQGQAHT
jgi:hypothetical protein